ncbi:MAG TPA: 2-oxo-4-hydroxy-4-carboxy-5-ureidoimidazoline decarboxylase [Bryobacteraceae bacterium]|jgi:OHCU decarboxylase
MPLSLNAINDFDQTQFTKSLGWVFEHSPWVADRAWHRRPFASRAHLSEEMANEVAAASKEEQLSLLGAHPDLGTRAKISAESTAEQASAGLDRLTAGEYARLTELNNAYRGKFGFPFLIAVKGSDKVAILEALERRLNSSPEDEFQEALRQVYRIARFRLESVVEQ